MQNKTLKSLLVKFLTVLCALCCCLGLVCGLVGCGEEVRSIVKTEINDKGELVIHYNIGEPENLGVVVGADGANGAPGANGAQGGILGNCEQHDFVTYTAQQATCQVKEITVNFCTKCNGYDIVVGETNGDVHGTFKKEIITDASTGDKVIIDYFESAIVELPAKPGDVAGACLEKQCELCEDFLETHEHITSVAVDTGVSICEEEHLEIVICADCKNPILDAEGKQQIASVPARGHAYKVDESKAAVLDDKDTASTKDDTYKVALVCEVCGEDEAFATATYNAEKSSPATCKVAGYDVFTYAYNAYDVAEATIVEKTGEIKNEYPVQTTHTFKTGEYVVEGYADGDPISYTKANTAALDALIEAKVIELTYAQDRKCEVYGKAVARCAVCDELINVTINAAHEYEAEVPATCIDDAYIPCKNCNVKEYTTLAIGHVWEYKADSFDAVALTADLDCKNCDAVKLDVPVTAGTVKQPTNCSERPITPYTTAKVENMPLTDPVHANYSAEIVVSFEIIDTTATPEHAYVNAEGKVLFTVKAGGDVDHNSDIAACIGKMTENPKAIECTYGPDATCQSTAPAVFRCQTCDELININLGGPHTEEYDANGAKFEHAATCTEDGYYYTKCNVGGYHEVEYETIPAQGHKFEIVDKDAFIAMVKADRAAAVENTTPIAIACECGDTATATLVKKEFAAGDPNTCAPFDTYTYTFEYAAAEEDDLAAKTYTFVITDTEGYEAHKVAGLANVTFYDGQTNINYETVAQFLGRVDAGKIEATFGPDANCGYAAPAVFRCELCQELINISVNGPHALDGVDVPVAPTCTTEGYTYQTCTAANCTDADRKIEIPGTRVPALQHAYTWTVAGAEIVYDALGIATDINYGTCTAVCANDATHTLTATAEEVELAQDCCQKTTLAIRYFVDADADGECDDAEVVATKTLVVEVGGDHNFVPEKIITIGENQYKYCHNGDKYIIVRI